MASVNKVLILGNCGRDPEIRYMADGKAVCNISIATSTRRKNRDTGETTESTEWHRVTFYDRLAEIAGEYVKKGKPVYVEGRLKYGKYTDKDGVEKNTCDIIATELQLLGGRDDGEQQQRSAPSRAPSHDAARARQTEPQRTAPARTEPGGSGFEDMDDDIPFISCAMTYDMTTSKARKMARYDY